MDKAKDKEIIERILESINIIDELSDGKTIRDIEEDIMLNNTIMFQFILIGENSIRLSDEYKKQKNTIPWNKIKGFRNSVVHNYDKVVYEIVNDTIKKDLPILKKELMK